MCNINFFKTIALLILTAMIFTTACQKDQTPAKEQGAVTSVKYAVEITGEDQRDWGTPADWLGSRGALSMLGKPNLPEKQPDLFRDETSGNWIVPNGIKVTENTYVYVTFVGEAASFNNVLGYYYYREADGIDDENLLKQIFLSTPELLTFQNIIYTQTRQLEFGYTYRLAGENNTPFEAGTVIGFCLFPHAGGNPQDVNPDGTAKLPNMKMKNGVPVFIATDWLLGGNEDKPSHVMGQSACGDFVIAFEDLNSSYSGTSDDDYNDLVFVVGDNLKSRRTTSLEPYGTGASAFELVEMGDKCPAGLNIVLSSSSVALKIDGEAAVTISGGTAPYSISVEDGSVVSAVLQDGVISLTGLAAGETEITVSDGGGATAILTVTVTETVPLVLSAETLQLKVSDQATVTVSGGTAPYVLSGGDEIVATESIEDEVITVTALAAGTSEITVTDADGTAIVLTVTVSEALTPVLEPNTLQLFAGGKGTVAISGGVAPYALSGGDETVATVVIAGNTITVTGQAAGSTTVTVTGADGGATELNITVADCSHADVFTITHFETGKLQEAVEACGPFKGSRLVIKGNTPFDNDGYTGGTNHVGQIISNDYRYLQSLACVVDFSEYTFANNEIPAYAFYGYDTKCKEIIFPASITKIGRSAFAYNNVSTIDLTQVTEIGDYAFFSVTALSTLKLQNINVIGQYAFSSSNVTSVEISGAPQMDIGVFSNCWKLLSVKMPACKEISDRMFYDCHELLSIEAPQVTTIGALSFSTCRKLSGISFPKTTTIGISAFNSCYALESADFPVLSGIAESAFSVCRSMKSFRAPVATVIEKNAFSHCMALVSVDLPLAETISSNAFSYCVELVSVSLPKAKTFQSNVFDYCAKLNSVDFPEATEFGSQVFRACTALTSVELPAALSLFGTFRGSKVESVSLPVATTIGEATFQSCSTLEYVDIPSAVLIANYAFSNCSALTFLDLPASVTTIRYGAFSGCNALVAISVAAETPPVNDRPTYGAIGIPATTGISVPVTSLEAYKIHKDWKAYANQIVGYQ